MIIAPLRLPRAQATPQTGEGQLGQAVAMQKSTQSQAEWQSKYAMMLKYPNLEAFSNASRKKRPANTAAYGLFQALPADYSPKPSRNSSFPQLIAHRYVSRCGA
jgi:hypothetical protein